MSHPYKGHSEMAVGKRRAKLATGGGVSDSANFARGGRAKHHKPHVNINIVHHSRGAVAPDGAAGLGAGAVPLPPVAGAPGPLPPQGLPPGMPPPGMKRGGRASGGRTDTVQQPKESAEASGLLDSMVNQKNYGRKQKSGGRIASQSISGIPTKGNISKWEGYARKGTKLATGGGVHSAWSKNQGGTASTMKPGEMRKNKKFGNNGTGTNDEAKHMKGRYP